MSYSRSHALAKALVLVLCVSVVLADCSVQPLFPRESKSPIDCGNDGGGSEFIVKDSSISFRSINNSPYENVEPPGVPLPDTLVLRIARFQNGRINKNASSVTLNGLRTFYGNDRDTFETCFQVIQIIVRQFEIGDCTIDAGIPVPKIASP